MLKNLQYGKAIEYNMVPPNAWKFGSFNDILFNLCNPLNPQKEDLAVTKNGRGITLTHIATKA